MPAAAGHGHLNPIAAAIPVFLVAIFFEWAVARARGRAVYRFADAVTDLSCGVLNQAAGLLLKLLVFAAYTAVYRRFALVSYGPGSAAPWALGVFLYDFTYYWEHRLSHEVNALWAVHVVHHQSEDYNLAVALRQPLLGGTLSMWLYWPLAVVGIPPLVFGVLGATSLLYQFWIHTELVGRLGALEAVMNTPSHHRVHHATNHRYLDRNYGGIFIVWDRLFGTYEPEVEPCTYGITKPLTSFNPLWANLHYWVEIGSLADRCTDVGDKLLAAFRRPGWDPESRRVQLPPEIDRARFRKFDLEAPLGAGMTAYVVVSFGAVAAGLLALLLAADRCSPPFLGVTLALTALTTLAWSGLFARRSWAWPLEAIRWAGTAAVLYLASG